MKDAIIKTESLLIKNPELAKEWNYEKNYPLTPADVYSNTHRFVFWKCPLCQRTWKAQIQRRNLGYCRCRECHPMRGSKKIQKGSDEFYLSSLAIKNPELAKEWNYEKNYPLTPMDILCRGKKEYWWKCPKCHSEWKNRIDHRCDGYGNCIRCNSLAVKSPFLLKEWDYDKNIGLDPYKINYHSCRTIHWKCDRGHEWDSSADNRNRINAKVGCPYCSNPPRRVCKENCLATVNPKLSKEWHPTKNGKLTPFDVTAFSNRAVWWMCPKGHEWESVINNRANGNGCPSCNGVVLRNGVRCDSVPEAYMYLQYKKRGLNFKFREIYGEKMGARRYDFYFPEENKYVEVTSYPKTCKNKYTHLKKIIKRYFKNISKKKRYVENVLHAKFELIQFVPTKKQIEYVKKNSK